MFTLSIDQELELQLFQLHHAEELFQVVDRNRRHLRKWIPWVDSITSPLNYHTLIPLWLKQFAENSALNTGIRYKGTLVGSIGLNQIDWHNRQTSIGYFLAEGYQGKGIMTRCVQGLLNYVFFHLNLHRVEIRCGSANIKSCAIPERLGFAKEGIIRDGEMLNNGFHDLIVYSKLYYEWTQRYSYR